MAKNTTIVIDGVEYAPKVKTEGNIKIVVLQRGWVVVGRFKRDGNDCTLEDASVIRTWGTTKGLGEIVPGPTSSTKLDKAGTIRFDYLTTVLIMDAEDSWNASL